MESYLQDLNEQQLAAVRYDGGPALVIAGAGSGKTRVLTNKIMYLVQNGYSPARILALTFTNKAAREMRSRISSLIGAEMASMLWMGTFHSMFLRILRFNATTLGFPSNFTIYDTTDTKSALKVIMKEMFIDVKKYPPSHVAAVISRAKNSLIDPLSYRQDAMLAQRDLRAAMPQIGEIYQAYWNRCKVSGAMDFDDILFYTNILFRDFPKVLEKYQNFFQYVLVDEYQDTNFAQHLIVQKLSRGHGKLCVVGDDAQSIYSFRGANISNILKMEHNYPGLKTFKLEQNYRSTQNILNVANSLIEKNRNQIKKRIFSTNSVGDKVQVVCCQSDYEESYVVTDKILQMKMHQGSSYSDFAILYRTNAQSRLFEDSMRKRNVPYRIYGGLSFYQRKEVKDALAYFRMTVNPNDDEALRRIINYPARGIGEKTVEKIRVAALANGVSMWDAICSPQTVGLQLNAGTIKKIEGFRDIIQSAINQDIAGVNAAQVAESIYARAGLTTSLIVDKTPENISRLENLNELLSAVNQFVAERLEQGSRWVMMNDFLSEVSLATDQDKEDDADTPKVTLMTVHAAKGLEFRNVYVVGVEDELFPSLHSAGSPAEIEEERRLLYVAITRAEEQCVLTYAMLRYRNGVTTVCEPSRFIRDIDPSLIDKKGGGSSFGGGSYGMRRVNTARFVPQVHKVEHLRPVTSVSKSMPDIEKPSDCGEEKIAEGVRIRHERFGEGVIIKVDLEDSAKITVDFDSCGTKVLMLKFAKFVILK